MSSQRPWLESLAACIPDPLVLARGDWSILWANREFALIVGAVESLRERSLCPLIDDWASFEAACVPFREGGRGAFRLRLVHSTGDLIPVEVNLAPCAIGLPAAWALHFRDLREITDLKRHLDARDRSHSFLQANTSDMIVRLDTELCVTWANESAGAIFPPGSYLSELIDESSVGQLRGSAGRFDVSLRSADSQRPAFQLHGVARRLSGDDGVATGLSLLLRDDSESLRMARFAHAHQLSAREEEVVEYLVKGYSNLNIASILGITESGVKFHIRNVYTRAKVGSRTELMARLLED